MPDIKIGILSKGDEVVNVFPCGKSIAIAVRRKGAKFDIVFIEKSIDGLPFISKKYVICEGDESVEVSLGKIKAATF